MTPSTKGTHGGDVMTLTSDDTTTGGPDAASTSVRLRWEQGVLVVAPQGSLHELAEHLDEVHDTQHDGPILFDLSDCVIEPGDLDLFSPERWKGLAGRVAIACQRISGRRLLHVAGVGEHLAVFMSVADALQAELHRRRGHGSGWQIAG